MSSNLPLFSVLLGGDYAGKSSAMARLAGGPEPVRVVSVDDHFLAERHSLIGRLRRDVVKDVAAPDGAYSPDFMASMLQTAVVHLRDQLLTAAAAADGQPLLVDSYYYKILAKCRLAGVSENPMYDWWRSFPQPRHVVYLKVAPQEAWRRSRRGTRLNSLEHYGERPNRTSFERYQNDLEKLMWDEIRSLPVTVVEQQGSPERTADAVREAVCHDYV
ncbi:hypothetical protein A8W25_03120 [Streptomyces sp. ERV7]|uniref:hypothetical protein n=1 Tax=Streptomyces sp. ERV7 TaxID=1322334 RepID=UPI0007F48193|nr:hypothetical protein [Streptomyces sp. ERV7]OAR27265.1 hypothetical protein A8W25_03120 [Streptomyces sp. ERV7]